jgi:microcystin-dependent protein
MGEPFVGEIRIFAGNFAPAGWMFCEGQTLSKDDYPALFNLIGSTYGGDGVTTFGLPDLRGRLPVHFGSGPFGMNFTLAETGGQETVTLTVNQIPAHTHAFQPTANNADSNSPANNLPAQPPVMLEYFGAAPSSILNSEAVGTTGGGQPHSNLQSYLCVSFIISLFGIFPPTN